MNAPLRRGMAAAALSSLALLSLAAPPASATTSEDGVECQDQALLDALAAAEVAADEARVVFTDLRGPLHREIKEQRSDLRAASEESRRELKQLLRELKGAESKTERDRIRDLIKAENKELRAELRLLRSRDLVEELKEERSEAREMWKDAKLALAEAREAVAACEQATPPAEPMPTDPAPADPAPGEPMPVG